MKNVQINLLPWREHARRAKKKRFISVFTLFFVIAVLIIIFFHIKYSAQLHDQLYLNSYLQSQINAEQASLTNLSAEEKKMQTVQMKLRTIIDLYAQSFQAIRLLNEIITITPRNVIVDKIDRNGNTITFAGMAQSDSDVTLFMKDIEKSPIFNQPELAQISNTSTNQRVFVLKVIQKGETQS